jgi:hypothetical protein
VLRRTFGPKRNEVTGEWRRLHSKELYTLYSSRNIIRVIKSRRLKWAGHVARMGVDRGTHRVLVGKPGGRKDKIKIYLRNAGCGEGGMGWIALVQHRDRWWALLNAAMNLRVP